MSAPQTGSTQPVVTYTYNAFGKRVATTQTVGNEWRKTEQNATYERADSQLWQVTTTTQSCSDASIAPLVTSSRRQLTGLTATNPIRTENIDVRGNVSESWTEVAPISKVWTSYQRVPYAPNLEVSHSRFGQTIEIVSLSGVTNAPGFDGLGRVVSAIDGRGNTTTFFYNSRGERVCAIDAATNITWSVYDAYGRLAAYGDRMTRSCNSGRGCVYFRR